MLQCSRQIGVACSCERYWVLPVFIGNHRQVYCEVFCVWRYVNRIAHPVLSQKHRPHICLLLSIIKSKVRNNNIPKVVCYIFCLELCSLFLLECPALLVPTGHSHSISRHGPRKSSTCATLLRAHMLLLQRLGLLVSSGVHPSRDTKRHCASC